MPVPAQARARVLKTHSRPPPVGGLNLIDSLVSMKETDALVLENYVARGNSVDLRRGHALHALMPARVESLMSYNGIDPKLFAAAGSNLYDVTIVGDPGPPVVTGLSNARWEYINVATPGGQFLEAVNGADSPRIWNGTTWQAITDISAPIAITGVLTSTLSQIVLHQNRVWFLQKDTLVAWYLGINSVGGVATAFDLRTVAKLGGSLVAIDTWTIDTGIGEDDNLVFITSEGEVLVYLGIDPSSSDTFRLKGVYRIGRPTGRRCTIKLRGDLLILAEGGIIAMSTLIQQGADRGNYITYKIQPEIGKFTKDFRTFGFEMLYYQAESLLILNIPETTNISRQYVSDINTPQAWSKWTGINYTCSEMFKGVPYLGLDGMVAKLWTVDNDLGAAITTRLKPAFSRYEHSERKNERRTRVYFSSAGFVTFGILINRDFEDTPPELANITTQASGLALWGTAIWGRDKWGSLQGQGAGTSEIATSTIGTYLSPYIITKTKDLGFRLNGSDHCWEPGGFT